MTLRVFLSLFEIVAFVATLAYFLSRVAAQLRSVCKTLGKITFGVRAVETQCAVIGPAARRINDNLKATAAGLQEAVSLAERVAPR